MSVENEGTIEDVEAIVLANEEVAKEDAFKVHTRIAATLRSIIVSNPTGGSIGLEGSWGSGKSTVVHFLKGMLEGGRSDKDGHPLRAHVAVFDAWSHEGDELRRAFLDQLADQIVEEDKLEHAKRTVWQSAKTIETDVQRKLSFNVFLAIVSLALSPTAVALLSIFGKDTAGIFSNQYAQLLLYFLAISPGLVLLKATLWSIFGWFLDCEGHGYGYYFRDEFRGRSSDDGGPVRTTTIQSAENSIDEFENQLAQILRLRHKNISLLVIAVDNIDRLPRDLTRSFWTALTPLFDAVRRKELCPGLQIWILMPYDRESLKRAFCPAEFEGFLDKTFDIALKVPPLLLTKWRTFMAQKLDASFSNMKPALAESEKQAVIDLFGTQSIEKITPRTISKFINSLRVAWEQHRRIEGIHLRVVAGYLLGYGGNLTPQPPHVPILLRDERVREGEIPRLYAAMNFGVSYDDAAQVLMADEIARAYLDGDINKLKSLQSFSGFGVVAEKTLQETLPQEPYSAHGDLGKVLATFAAIDKAYLRKDPWKNVLPSMRLHKAWASSLQDLPEIIDLVDRDVKKASLRKVFLHNFTAILKEPLSDRSGPKQWLDAAQRLYSMGQSVHIPREARSCARILFEWFSRSKLSWELPYKIDRFPADLSSHLPYPGTPEAFISWLTIYALFYRNGVALDAGLGDSVTRIEANLTGDQDNGKRALAGLLTTLLLQDEARNASHLANLMKSGFWDQAIFEGSSCSSEALTVILGTIFANPKREHRISSTSKNVPSSDVSTVMNGFLNNVKLRKLVGDAVLALGLWQNLFEISLIYPTMQGIASELFIDIFPRIRNLEISQALYSGYPKGFVYYEKRLENGQFALMDILNFANFQPNDGSK